MDFLSQIVDIQTLINFFQDFGYVAVFLVLLLCGFGIPIPEDVTLVAGGIISGLEYANVHVMVAVGMFGVLCGDGLMFAAGRVFGDKILKNSIIKRVLTPQRFADVQSKFEKYGHWVLFIARFLPGLRTPIFLTAGLSRKVSFWKFLTLDGFAALISVPVWVYLGYYGAHEREWLLRQIKNGQTGVLVACVILALGLSFYFFRKARKKENA